MLAGNGRPFDSDEHLFEVKWDGIRVVAFVSESGHRLQNRRLADITPRYPELAGLAGLPAGTVLDGEIVVLRDGKPDFELMQARWGVGDPRHVRALAAEHPVTYVAFDLLYAGGRSVMARPLAERRERLEEILGGLAIDRLVFSEGVTGAGKTFFDAAAEQGLEGVMAKRLASRYLPGRRSDSWLKVKARKLMVCAVIGFVPDGPDDLKSLIVAAPDEAGELRSVGRVGTGFGEEERARLSGLLRERPRPEPLVPTPHAGEWVEPGLYVKVRYQEKTKAGELRAPVFLEMVSDE
ncbi:MAG: ATP-dependent DNA ligase [Planctomycetota bacterium]|jgi:DNA ligase D-like protein (predicted ligase)